MHVSYCRHLEAEQPGLQLQQLVSLINNIKENIDVHKRVVFTFMDGSCCLMHRHSLFP